MFNPMKNGRSLYLLIPFRYRKEMQIKDITPFTCEKLNDTQLIFTMLTKPVVKPLPKDMDVLTYHEEKIIDIMGLYGSRQLANVFYAFRGKDDHTTRQKDNFDEALRALVKKGLFFVRAGRIYKAFEKEVEREG
jgi:hypothetical protein